MKELSIEEKAKRYDEAIESARKLYYSEETGAEVEIACENIFPELIEFKDERIRKALMRFHKSTIEIDGIKGEDIIAWLEKQGEQKSFDYENANIQQKDFVPKIEPKFHEGDWVVCEVTGSVYQIKDCIEDVTNHKYGYNLTNGGYIPTNGTNDYHLWTIQDAKDGDVLAWDDCKCVVLFKNIYDEVSFNSHGFIGHCTSAFHSGLSYHSIEGARPATKEQRDLLFQKMKDAGYEFDFEKKELKKIEKHEKEI